ncbi:hypothetical protein ACLK1W_18725 [Escherichia coli]
MAQHTFLVEIGTAELPPKALRSLAEAFADNLKSETDQGRSGLRPVSSGLPHRAVWHSR